MKKFKCLLTAMLLGCSTMSFAQFMNGSGSSASSSSDVEAWKGLRFSNDRVFINQDFDDPDDLDIGINFSRHSDSESESDEYYGYTVGYESKNSITQLGLNIPINLVYGVKINEELAIKPYTGFYLRVNLMAKEKEEFTLNNVGIGYALDFNEITEKTKTSKFMVKLGYNF